MLKTAFIALLLVPVGVPSPSESEQQGAETATLPTKELRILDPRGDLKLEGAASGQNQDQYAHADIRSGWIANETLTQVEFGLQLQRFSDSSGLPSEASPRGFSIDFDLGGMHYAIFQRMKPYCGGSDTIGFMRWRNNGGSISCNLKAEFDASTATIKVRVDRAELTNETNHPFGPGLDLANFTIAAEVRHGADAAVALRASDRAPDTGPGLAYRSILGNVTGAGGLELLSRDPIRVSNGESTTMVYPVEIHNRLPGETTVVVEAATNETEWRLRAPTRIVVPPNGVVKFPVILSMGFTHRHGELSTFHVRVEDVADAGRWSAIQLGVYWLKTPQPAGHHDTLWLHSEQTPRTHTQFSVPPAQCQYRRGWLNAVEDEARGAGADVEASGCAYEDARPNGTNSYPLTQSFAWAFYHEPELAIGLDFDLERSARFATEIRPRVNSQRAILTVELLYCEPGSQATYRGSVRCDGNLAVLGRATSTPRAVTANSPASFELEFLPTKAADLLPFQRGSSLILSLRFTTEGPQGPPNTATPDTAPTIAPKKSVLQLPLIEYHDPIDQAFQNVGTLRVRPLAPFEKPVNPGRTVLFPFEISNTGATAQQVRVELEGPGREWATIAPHDAFEAAPGSNQTIRVRIDAPDDAQPGERAELFFVAQSTTDPNVVAISRLRAAVVDPNVRDIPDEEDTAGGEDKRTPGPALALTLVALLGAAWVGRRRS